MGANRSTRAVSAVRIDDQRAGHVTGPSGRVIVRVPAGMFERTSPACGISAAAPPMFDESADKRPLSEGAAENRPLCEVFADICRLSATSTDSRPMSASSAREPPLSADVRRHPSPVRLLCRQWLDVRHLRRDGPPVRQIARESRSIGREGDTNFGLGTPRTYERKCQNRPFSHPAPPAQASRNPKDVRLPSPFPFCSELPDKIDLDRRISLALKAPGDRLGVEHLAAKCQRIG